MENHSGRRVFIKDGQDLASAMKESGKFNLSKKQKEAGDKLNEKARKSAEEDIRFYLDGNSENWESDGDFIRELANEYGLETEEAKKMFNDIKRTNLETKYQKYVNETLNNDEYLKANRPNEYWQKQMKESNVKTFADEIKEQEKKSNEKFSEIKVKGDSNVIPRDFEKGYGKFKIKTNANDSLDDRFEITKDENGFHAKNLRTGETYATFREHLRNNNVFEFENTNKNQINNTIRQKAYQKYMKEHPGSKMSFEDFKDMRK